MLPVTFCLVAAIVLTIFVWLKRRNRHGTVANCFNIPGPACSNASVGHLPDVWEHGGFRNFLEYLHSTYGDVAKFFFGKHVVVSVADSKHLDQASQLFSKPAYCLGFFRDILGPNNMHLYTGKQAKRMRPFLRNAITASYLENNYAEMLSVAQQHIQVWRRAAEEYRTVPAQQYLLGYVFNITASIVFGAETIAEIDSEILATACDVAFGMAWEKNKANSLPQSKLQDLAGGLLLLRKSIDKLVTSRLSKRLGDSLVDKLLSQDNPLTGKPFDMDVQQMILRGFLTSAYHPTTSALSWTLYYLSTNREVLQKCQSEVDMVFANAPAPEHIAPSWYDLFHSFPYLKAAIQESMRLMPPLPYTIRMTETETRLGKYLLPAHCPVILPLSVVQRQAANWGPNSNDFDPTRFLYGKFQATDLAFCPFGVGPRSCPAETTAWAEMLVFLSMLLWHIDLHPPDDEPSINPEVEEKFVLWPKTSKMAFKLYPRLR